MFWNWLLMKLVDPTADDLTVKMLTEDYPDNPFLLATVMEKLTPRAMIEAAMRAESGKELTRPFGSPVVLSPWDKILLNPKQIFALPAPDYQKVSTQTVIGPRAAKPLQLAMPLLITGMSYGGSLNLPLKIALAKGADLAGTATNTGESAVTDEERKMTRLLIGQYHRGGFLSGPKQLNQLDAIEIQLGQGAWGGAVDEPISADKIGDHLRAAWHMDQGQSATIYARMPGKNTPQDYVDMINKMKEEYAVPIGVKIAGSDYIEQELAMIAQTQADYIVIDGAEGGTAASNPTLQDHLGLPTFHTLVRTVDWLIENHLRDRFTVIATGGLTTPGHFLKALALGADAVYLGSIAVVAAVHTQLVKAMPQALPTQLSLYTGKMSEELDIDLAARHLFNYLTSCIAEMKLAVQALGKDALVQLDRSDLVTVDPELAQFAGIRYAASHRPLV